MMCCASTHQRLLASLPCTHQAEVFQTAVDAAVHKHHAPLPKLVLMGISAGLYIGLGFTTCALVGGNLSPEFRKAQPGAFAALYSLIGFPLGLILIVFCGGDLFTGGRVHRARAGPWWFIWLDGRQALLDWPWISTPHPAGNCFYSFAAVAEGALRLGEWLGGVLDAGAGPWGVHPGGCSHPTSTHLPCLFTLLHPSAPV